MQFPGETVLSRLIETVEKSVGGLLAPWQIRRTEEARTDARIRERLQLKKLEIDIADIHAGKKCLSSDGRILEGPPKSFLLGTTDENFGPNLPNDATQRFAEASRNTARTLDMQKMINLKQAVLFAEEEAERIDGQSNAESFETIGQQSSMAVAAIILSKGSR